MLIVSVRRLSLQQHYISDWTDGLHWSVLSPLLYMYVAIIAPTIAFGGLLQDATKDSMGMMEMYVQRCCCPMKNACA